MVEMSIACMTRMIAARTRTKLVVCICKSCQCDGTLRLKFRNHLSAAVLSDICLPGVEWGVLVLQPCPAVCGAFTVVSCKSCTVAAPDTPIFDGLVGIENVIDMDPKLAP